MPTSPARLDGADLRGARLHGADLRGARLDGADLNGARADGDTVWPSPDGAPAGVVLEARQDDESVR